MRLIDADALKTSLLESKEQLWKTYNSLKNHVDKQICGGEIASFTGAILRIEDAPTIDAVPVVHGRWKDVFGGKYDNQSYRCSVCKEHALFDDKGWLLTNFCPNCGAKMDGDK